MESLLLFPLDDVGKVSLVVVSGSTPALLLLFGFPEPRPPPLPPLSLPETNGNQENGTSANKKHWIRDVYENSTINNSNVTYCVVTKAYTYLQTAMNE